MGIGIERDTSTGNSVADSTNKLQHENSRLQQVVKTLLKRIEENQRIEKHFQEFEFKLLGSNSLSGVLHLLLNGAMEHFQLDDVGLILVDRDYTVNDLLEALDIDRFDNRLQLRNSDDFAMSLYPGDYQISLGELDPLTSGRLFPNSSRTGSAALLPLLRQGQMIGSLHFASQSAQRFSADKAVDFMHHLASICAVCLENSLAHEHLNHQSQVDMLTQVSNRLHFEAEFAKELERAERSDDGLACLFVDVDHFKRINDQFGHQAGDACLKRVAMAIKQQLRKTDLLARYGGEEFVVLLPRCTQEPASEIAERIRASVAALRVDVAAEEPLKPTVSLGLACWQPVGERSSDLSRLGQRLISCADDAMYEAKSKGRNCVVIKPFCQLV
ncbi:sensor domain-containing diguanylate cyclase [Pseudomaricurvus alkylphenolicus]|jgi:diguanylate cyclase (GGDEF)-like protein|uniref:GGDEF domain-containing protein n=1 Tax=Pseudomaricurvus alkylphenolicus TaxID=1306991 RepID=UPI00141E6971|nr:sensor domain-containing diguanylate cyclase [Pseudomaricurvus alkylphenolicus]NIB44375.1 sensor domain-containing diguanylate cyclase [Pseudomaricurvus alkylphenolicus]